jgi:hypothetical protein
VKFLEDSIRLIEKQLNGRESFRGIRRKDRLIPPFVEKLSSIRYHDGDRLSGDLD